MKKLILSLVMAIALIGGVYGAAASLGTLTTQDIGATSADVASCDTDGVETAYTVDVDPSDDTLVVVDVTISNIADACRAKPIVVSISDISNNVIAADVTTVQTGAGGNPTVFIPDSTGKGDSTIDLGTANLLADADDLFGIHVLITDGVSGSVTLSGTLEILIAEQ